MQKKKGLIFFSTPFDDTAVDFLEKMRVPLYKVASFEVVDLELLKKIGRTKKPVIVSRGMASFREIAAAVKTLKRSGAPEVAVLHCVSSYPALPEQMNLATIPDLAKKLKVVSGLSDHTLGTTTALISVGLGAHIIEKHFTLKRSDGGPDAAFSLEPREFAQLVRSARSIERTIGRPTYKIGKRESENRVFRRSLFVVKDIKIGEKFSRRNVRCIRPGYGMKPEYLRKIIGKRADKNVQRGTPLARNLIKGGLQQ